MCLLPDEATLIEVVEDGVDPGHVGGAKLQNDHVLGVEEAFSFLSLVKLVRRSAFRLIVGVGVDSLLSWRRQLLIRYCSCLDMRSSRTCHMPPWLMLLWIQVSAQSCLLSSSWICYAHIVTLISSRTRPALVKLQMCSRSTAEAKSAVPFML